MRRRMVSVIGAALLLGVGSVPAGARQEAAPANGLAELGLPEIEVAITAEAYEGIPESIEAGRYLITVTADESLEFGGGISFIRPEGVTAEEFLGALAGPPEGDGSESAATPGPEAEGTPAEGSEGPGAPPPFVYDSLYAGGAFAGGGASAQAVVDLSPGEWIAWGDDPEATQEPVVVEVTGEMPSDLTEPESGATLTMSEYDIQVTAGELVAGEQVIKVENVGAQPHFLVLAKGPDDMTEAQVEVMLEEEMAAQMAGSEPEYSDLNPDEDFGEGPYTPSQSNGTATWHPVDLEAGTYVMACFFPDVTDGAPHTAKGMYTVIEVAA